MLAFQHFPDFPGNCLTRKITYVTFGHLPFFDAFGHFSQPLTGFHAEKFVALIHLHAQLNMIQTIAILGEAVFCLRETTFKVVHFSLPGGVCIPLIPGDTSHDKTRRVRHESTTLKFMMAAGKGQEAPTFEQLGMITVVPYLPVSCNQTIPECVL